MTTDHLLGTKQLSFSSIFHFLQFFFDSTLSFRRIPIDTIARSMTRKSENYQEEASFIKFYLLNFFTKRNNTTSTTYKCIHFQYPFQILHRNKHITRPFHFPFHNQPFSSAFSNRSNIAIPCLHNRSTISSEKQFPSQQRPCNRTPSVSVSRIHSRRKQREKQKCQRQESVPPSSPLLLRSSGILADPLLIFHCIRSGQRFYLSTRSNDVTP